MSGIISYLGFGAIPLFAFDSSPVDLFARHLTDFPSLGIATLRIPLARSATCVFVAYNFGLHHFVRSDSAPLHFPIWVIGRVARSLTPKDYEVLHFDRGDLRDNVKELKEERCGWFGYQPPTLGRVALVESIPHTA